MPKLSIETLFPGTKYATRKLDVKTISATLEEKKPELLNIKILEEKKKKNEERAKKLYDIVYSSCIKKINDACRYGKNDIIFMIPDNKLESIYYSKRGCIDYITDKLMENNLACIYLGQDQLFITWKYSQDNVDKK